jgi:hypothetical protein
MHGANMKTMKSTSTVVIPHGQILYSCKWQAEGIELSAAIDILAVQLQVLAR